MLPRL
jgi:hypothetical protein